MPGFRQGYSPRTSLMHSVNLRCRPEIIRRGNEFATSTAPRLEKRIESHRKVGGPKVCGWASRIKLIPAVRSTRANKAEIRGVEAGRHKR